MYATMLSRKLSSLHSPSNLPPIRTAPGAPDSTQPLHDSVYFFAYSTHMENAGKGRVDTKIERIQQRDTLLHLLYLITSITGSNIWLLLARWGWFQILGAAIIEHDATPLAVAEETVLMCVILDFVGVWDLSNLFLLSEGWIRLRWQLTFGTSTWLQANRSNPQGVWGSRVKPFNGWSISE